MLYAAIRKYGDTAFDIKVIETCVSDGEACAAEKRWISELGTRVPLEYNVTVGGDGVVGVRHTDEWRAAMSQRLMGHATSEETRAKIAATNLGKKRSDLTRQRQREAWTRRGAVSEETKAKQSAAMKGCTFSDEHRANLSKAATGRTYSAETRAKMSASAKARRAREAASK